MRKFKHKITEKIVKQTPSMEFYSTSSEVIPAWVIENSSDWEEIIEKDYERLLYKGNILYSVKRLSDGVEFKIGDKLDFSDGDDDKCYKSITEISLNSIGKDGIGKRTIPWLQCGKDYGTCLEYAQLVKEPILTTEDGYECTLDDRVFGVLPKANWQTDYYDEEGVPVSRLFNPEGKRWNPSSEWLWFKTKENAEKYIYENKPEFSRKQINEAIDNISSPLQWFDADVLKQKLNLK